MSLGVKKQRSTYFARQKGVREKSNFFQRYEEGTEWKLNIAIKHYSSLRTDFSTHILSFKVTSKLTLKLIMLI